MKQGFARPTILLLAIWGSTAAAPLTRTDAQASKRPPAAVRQSATSLTALVGTWKVTAVQVADAGVQALVTNDPSYMGAVLTITPRRLAWRPHKGGGELSDVCDMPRLARDGLISCARGAFGPPDTRLVAVGRTVRLDWYDGGTLVLSRLR